MRTPDPDTAQGDVLSVAQAARELHLSPRAVLHRIASGRIAATKLGPGTAGYIIARAEIDRLKTQAAS